MNVNYKFKNEHFYGDLYQPLKYISFCCSALSILSSTLIIFSYVKFTHLRSIAFKFIVYMSIADLISSIARFLSLVSFYSEFDPRLCKMQAFVINWFQLSSLCWTVVISWSAWCSVIRNYNVLNVKEVYFLAFGYIPGAIIAIV